ncbi:MAG: hypothetical protein KBT06_07075 [Prevotellaceae bacterium]|nr:hypothetical protein [Candidatus Colivivens equi]
MSTLYSVVTRRCETKPQRIRIAPDSIPGAISLQTGMSTRYALPRKYLESLIAKNEVTHRHEIRCAYGRNKRAHRFFAKEDFNVFYPVIYTLCPTNIKELSIPNILYVNGPYKGIEGVMKHNKGQQRTGIVVGNLF